MVNAILTTIGAGMLGIVVWAFNLSNRVTSLEAGRTGLRELIDTKFGEINRRLEGIENSVREILLSK